MAGRKELVYEYCIGIIGRSGEDFGFQHGQSQEETIRQLEEHFSATPIPDEDLLGMMQAVDPTYVITEQDQAERQARRELSERARTNFFKFMHDKISLVDTSKVHLERGFDCLLDDSGTLEAEAFNQEVLQVFALNGQDQYINGTTQDRTRVMEKFIDRITNQDYSDLFTLSDEQLVERLPKLYSAFVMAVEGGDAMLNRNKGIADPTRVGFELDDEYVAKLKNFRAQHQGLFASLKNRFDTIMDPSYELIHVDRLVPDADHTPDFAYDMGSPYEAARKSAETTKGGTPIYPEYYQLNNTLSRFFATEYQGWKDRANHIARSKGIDPKNVELTRPDGSVIDLNDLNSMIGVGVLRMKDKESGKTYTLKSNTVYLTEVAPEQAFDMVSKDNAAIMTAMDAADPWYIRIFTGSRQFNEMKKAQEAVLKLRNKMGDTPNKEQLQEMNKALNLLEQKAEAYVEYKGEIDTEAKSSERSRIQAAKAALRRVQDSRMLLDAYAETLDAVKTQEAPGPEKKQTVSLEDKIWDHYMGLADDDPMAKLGSKIYGALSATQGALPEKPLEEMARMVAFDLVMRERVARGGTGPIEERYSKNPDEFLKGLQESEALRNAASMDAEGFRKFVDTALSANGIQQLTNSILQEQALKAQEAQQAAKAPQELQAQAPQIKAPEPPKPQNPGIS